ncbi:hypothetical protein HNQ34_003129 [Anoxybacillus tepidamans]|uniref:Uncharacterized protein n=1 Tax=Anoxybacteroides tepidamans TaxID=265948 RepID=A0A7W8IUA0_9BACL|nr:hypothetical protein [Anoxybacillus tepidamans]
MMALFFWKDGRKDEHIAFVGILSADNVSLYCLKSHSGGGTFTFITMRFVLCKALLSLL